MSARDSLCVCGHEKRAHPYVGSHTSWPNRCTYCECLGYKPRETDAEARAIVKAGYDAEDYPDE